MTWGAVFQWVIGLFNWWVTVMPWEQGLRVRMGKTVASLEPGMHLRVPIIDRVFVQGMRLRTSDLGTQTVRTADGKPRTVSAVLRYQIADLRKLYEFLQDAEDTVVDLARAALAREIERGDSESTARDLGRATTRRLRLHRCGLAGGRVQIVDLVDARTYRLLSDDKPFRTASGLDTVARDV